MKNLVITGPDGICKYNVQNRSNEQLITTNIISSHCNAFALNNIFHQSFYKCYNIAHHFNIYGQVDRPSGTLPDVYFVTNTY